MEAQLGTSKNEKDPQGRILLVFSSADKIQSESNYVRFLGEDACPNG
jgi:hypothetical protein